MENRNANIPVKGVKTPMKGAADSSATKKEMETPKSQVRPTSSQSCSKAFGSSVSTVLFSPNSSVSGANAREAAKIAKLQSTVERINKVAELKEKWAEERKLKQELNTVKRAIEFKRLQDDSSVAAEKRRENLEKQRVFAEKQRTEKKEALSSSLTARTQLAADLQKQAKAKRRISVFLNGKMKKLAAEREAKLLAEQKQFEVELLASRRLDFLQTREAKKDEETRKRESLCNRGIAAREQKSVEEELRRAALKEEQDLLETRHQDWTATKTAQQAEDKRKRESLAFRLQEWREQKAVVEGVASDAKKEESSLAASRASDWKDVQSYKDQQLKRDRESLAGRLKQWHAVREVEESNHKLALEAAHIEAELAQQCHDDVKKYEARQKAAARQSLAYRLEKASKDREFDAGQIAFRTLVSAAEEEIAQNDRKDVEEYRLKIQAERRQSLAYRNHQEATYRSQQAEKHRQELEQRAQDRELSDLAWKDVQNYQAKQREAARKSLANRLAESARQHDLDVAAHHAKLSALHDDLELRRLDWANAQQYKAEQAQRRRQSMMLRGESARMQRMAEAMLAARKEMEADEEARLREQDREALLTAKAALAASTRADRLNTSVVL